MRLRVQSIDRQAHREAMLPRGRHDLGHKATVIVVQERAWHRAEEREGMYMPIKPSLGIRRRISADITGIAVRQIKGKEVRLLFNTPNNNQRFAKIRLTVTPADGSAAQTSRANRASGRAHSL